MLGEQYRGLLFGALERRQALGRLLL